MELKDIMIQQQLNRGLQMRPHTASEYRIQINHLIYVYREKLKHRAGSHLVINCGKKKVLVNLRRRERPRS